jgi:hypothetical protein
MARKIFDISGAPRDEVVAIQNLLSRKNINFYETPDSGFRRSTAALWVRDDNDLEYARELIENYEKTRMARNRANSRDIRRWSFFSTFREDESTKSKGMGYAVAAFIFAIVLWMLVFGFQRPML